MVIALSLFVGFLAGVLVGGFYCLLLWRSVRLLLGGGRTVTFALLAMMRVAMVVLLVWLAFHWDVPVPVIAAALAGFAVVRLAATRIPSGGA